MWEQILSAFEVFGYFFVIIAAVLAMIASAYVNSTFRRYSQTPSRRGLTGAQAAQRVLRQNGVAGVIVSHTPGTLTDHYDPRSRTVFLSDAVYDKSTPAAIGVAAHEAGHAVQHARAYLPLRVRNAVIPVTNIGSRLAMPLILIGLFMSFYWQSPVGYDLALIGVFGYGLVVFFQLVTLPTEFNASRRALAAIEEGHLLDEDELSAARKTLRAAALTYVAALAVSLVQFLRLLAIVTGQKGRRR